MSSIQISLLESLPHLNVCALKDMRPELFLSILGDLAVAQKTPTTLPERDLPGHNTLFFLHADYVSGLQLLAVFSGVLHKEVCLPSSWVTLYGLLSCTLHFIHKPVARGFFPGKMLYLP